MAWLLDTSILSDLLRNPQAAAGHVALIGDRDLCTSIIVAAELRYGALRRQSPRLTAQLEAILAAIDILPFDAPADLEYARIRVALEKAGMAIGGNDLLIAAHALATGCVLVTDNEREFVRVPGLRTENWLRPQI